MFPERPTCHQGARLVAFYPPQWRPPDESLPVRTCSYCGSIHPEDLLTLLGQGATLSGSDWKYGWPHKFYVDGIPNPHAGEIQQCGSESWGKPGDYQLSPEEIAAGWHVARTFPGGVTIERPILAPASQTLTSKWYNEHLLDEGYDDATRSHLIEQLAEAADILFEIRDGKLYYRAPYAGYQR